MAGIIESEKAQRKYTENIVEKRIYLSVSGASFCSFDHQSLCKVNAKIWELFNIHKRTSGGQERSAVS